MSGSTDAATIAERTKLEQQLREAQEGLDDTYYGHAMDSMSDALDDELDSYTKNAEDYIESLRESIKETDLLVEQTYQKVLQNTDIILQTITEKAEEYGFYIDEELTAPWENAQTESLNLETSATSHIDSIYNKVNSVTSNLTANITKPWKDGKKDLLSFSEEVPKQLDLMLQEAQANQTAILNTTKDFVGDMKYQIDLIPTYADAAAQRMLDTARKNVEQINAEYAKIEYPSHEGGDSGGGSDGGGDTTIKQNNPPKEEPKETPNANVKKLQQLLNTVFGAGLAVDGLYGDKTKAAVKSMQNKLKSLWKLYNSNAMQNIKSNGLYDYTTKQALYDYLLATPSAQTKASKIGITTKLLPKITHSDTGVRMYAKGTLGTKKDEWAITDEIGDELVMYATPEGRLSYMRAGSTVVPHDLTKELINIGEVGLDGLRNMPQFNSGVNLNSNYISKPEFNLTFDALVKAERIDENTLPEVKKFVQQEINSLVKQMNYAIRGKGGR